MSLLCPRAQSWDCGFSHAVASRKQPFTEKNLFTSLGEPATDLEVKHLGPSLRGHRACSAFSGSCQDSSKQQDWVQEHGKTMAAAPWGGSTEEGAATLGGGRLCRPGVLCPLRHQDPVPASPWQAHGQDRQPQEFLCPNTIQASRLGSRTLGLYWLFVGPELKLQFPHSSWWNPDLKYDRT